MAAATPVLNPPLTPGLDWYLIKGIIGYAAYSSDGSTLYATFKNASKGPSRCQSRFDISRALSIRLSSTCIERSVSANDKPVGFTSPSSLGTPSKHHSTVYSSD